MRPGREPSQASTRTPIAEGTSSAGILSGVPWRLPHATRVGALLHRLDRQRALLIVMISFCIDSIPGLRILATGARRGGRWLPSPEGGLSRGPASPGSSPELYLLAPMDRRPSKRGQGPSVPDRHGRGECRRHLSRSAYQRMFARSSPPTRVRGSSPGKYGRDEALRLRP